MMNDTMDMSHAEMETIGTLFRHVCYMFMVEKTRIFVKEKNTRYSGMEVNSNNILWNYWR